LKPETVRRRLLAWFRREKRELPWRGTRDPYRIWVSEVMLQQTTVGAVRGRYENFLQRFPDLGALARASEESVLAEWSGLGYYARARNLRLAARAVVERHGGRLPGDPEALRALPGFGSYTAAAVASLAFGARLPAADANVTRVLSRLDAIAGTAGSRAHAQAVHARAEALVARGRAGDVTAALMDLGQLVCTPRRPSCPACPLAGDCAARRRGEAERFPERKPRRATERVFVAAACAVRGRAALLLRGDDALLGGLWQFPTAEGATPAAALRALRRTLARLGLDLDSQSAPALARHTIVHRRLEIRVFRALAAARPAGDGRGRPGFVRWLTAGELDRAAIPTLTRRIAAAAGFLPLRGSRRPGERGARSLRNGRRAGRSAILSTTPTGP